MRHLFLGDNDANVADMVAKGRHRPRGLVPLRIGERQRRLQRRKEPRQLVTNPGAVYNRERYAKLDHVGRFARHRTVDIIRHLRFTHAFGPHMNKWTRDQVLHAHKEQHA